MKLFIAFTSAFALALSGCALLQALEGGSGGSTTTAAAAGGSTPVAGSDCGQDPDTSAVLCLGNNVCPSVTIDTNAYPGCGFRVSGYTVDIECSCSGWLCPLGATTCTDAQTKLSAENLGTVCGQMGTGVCVQGTPVTSSSSSSSTSAGGTCDQSCLAGCDGEPICIQTCGC